MTFRQLAARAAKAAARLRAEVGIGPADAVCPYDLAERLGVVVWLGSLPSMEGMYSPGKEPAIVVSAERPPGRRRHTCAHELGHHVFGHGLRLDQVVEESGDEGWQPEEFLADRFAVGLLMPKFAVEAAITRRDWNAATLTAEQAFVIAQDLGVGYGNLIGHLERTLGLVDTAHAKSLRGAGRQLSRIRANITGCPVGQDLVVVDRHWGVRAIDMEVGDMLLVPDGSELSGHCISMAREPTLHIAVAPGQGTVRLMSGPASMIVRVARREFTGLARYRHLEDSIDDI